MAEDRKTEEHGRHGPSGNLAEEFDSWTVAGADHSKQSSINESQYDRRPQEDRARRNIAYLLIGLLWFICVASFATLWSTRIAVEDVMKIFQALIGPVIALVSAATGFYYATKSK